MDYRYEWTLGIAAVAGVWLMLRPDLDHFSASEFGIWWPLMDADLLRKLDELRGRWGRPVHISSATGAIGRATGATSQHDVIHGLGIIRAVDIFPEGRYGSTTADEAAEFVELAAEVGFTGIGVYTDTQFGGEPWRMVHVDVRPTEAVATWARVGGEYVALERGLV